LIINLSNKIGPPITKYDELNDEDEAAYDMD
jgi:hypothetical protein